MTEKKSQSECEIGLKGELQASKLMAYRIGEWVDKSIEEHRRSGSKVSHKEWFIKNFGNEIGYSTAMKRRGIFKICFGHPEWVLTFSLTKLEMLCAKDCPEEARKYLFENGRPNAPNEEYKRVIQGIKDGIYDEFSPEVQALCRFDDEREDFVERMKVDNSEKTVRNNILALIESRSEAIENSNLSEDGKLKIKGSNKKIMEELNSQDTIYKTYRNEPEFHLPKKTPKLKRNSQI